MTERTVVLYTCLGAANQIWRINLTSNVVGYGNKCLKLMPGTASAGNRRNPNRSRRL